MLNMKLASIILAGASLSSAHTIFSYLEVGGVTGAYGAAIREPGSNSPVQDVTSDDIACNAIVTSSDTVIDVTAGSSVQAIWRHDSNDVIDKSHVGPVTAYLKKVDSAKTTVGAGDGWFKISEAGLVDATSDPQVWAVTDLIAANGSQEIPIPSCIEDGQYLLRAEILALHSASSSGGAQFYMECAQINVSGGTAVQTPATVSFPGAYSATDPGILVGIYYPFLTNYTIPGPEVFTCGTGTSATAVANAAASTSVKASSASSSVAVSITSVAPSTSTANVIPTTLQTSTVAPSSVITSASATAAAASSAATMPAGTTVTDVMAWLNEMVQTLTS